MSYMASTLRVGDFDCRDVEDALNEKVGEDGLIFSVEGFKKDDSGEGMTIHVLMGLEDEDEIIGSWKVVGSSIAYEVAEAPDEEEDEPEGEED